MKITGNQIREALRRAVFRRQILDQQFSTTLYAFKGEDKSTPDEIAKGFQQADEQVAMLQAIQQYFNQRTNVEVQGNKIPLALAIKLIGGAGRVEKMWREAAGGGKKERFNYSDDTKVRTKDQIRAEAQVTPIEALKRADKAARWASALREAIANGNAQSLELSKDIGFEIPKGLLD
jgi:hypothetical protein